MKKIIYLLVVLLLAGCVTQRRCNDKYPTVSSTNTKDSIVIRDSVVFKTVYNNIPVIIPDTVIKDSVRIVDGKGFPALTPLVLRGRFSTATSWVNSGVLYGRLDEGGTIMLRVKNVMQERYIKELRSKLTEKQSVKIVKETPKLVKILAWIGGILSVLVLTYFANKIFGFTRYL